MYESKNTKNANLETKKCNYVFVRTAGYWWLITIFATRQNRPGHFGVRLVGNEMFKKHERESLEIDLIGNLILYDHIRQTRSCIKHILWYKEKNKSIIP